MRNLESSQENLNEPKQEVSELQEKGEKEKGEKAGDKIALMREKLARTKQERAEEERASKEMKMEAKIKERTQLVEVKEEKKEQLSEARELLEQAQEDLGRAQENLQKAKAELEEAQEILKEYLSLEEVSSEEARKMQEIVEEMEQTCESFEKEVAVLEKKRYEVVGQIEALSRAIQELEVSIEEIASDPEVAQYLQKIEAEKVKKEEEESKKAEEKILRVKKEIEEGRQTLSAKIQELATKLARAQETQRYTEKEIRKMRENIGKNFFNLDIWRRRDPNLVKEALEIFQKSDSPEEFVQQLSDLKKNRYSGLTKRKERKAIEVVLDLVSNNHDFQKWSEYLKALKHWQKDAQIPEQTLEELVLEYSSLIGKAWEIKRNYPKQAEKLPFEIYHGLEKSRDETIKRLDQEKEADDKIRWLKKLAGDVVKQAGGFDLIFQDPLEKKEQSPSKSLS